MKKSRKLTVKEIKFLDRLERLLEKTPDTIELFSWAGDFVALDKKTGQHFSRFSPIIHIDGGDPETEFDEDGVQYVLPLRW
jgi:hypothetical protein